jgi:hypothetical protein
MSERKPRGIPRDWQPSARQIEAALLAAKQAIGTLTDGERDDYRLLVDTVEGESDLLELLDRLAEQRKSDELFIKQIEGRLKRYKARADKAKELYRKIAEAAELPERLDRPFYLATYAEDPPHAHIINETLLPRDVLRPDMRDITARLKRGEPVPGAILNNPGSKHIVLRFS